MGAGKRAARGHPWVYSNEIDMTAAAKALAPGSLVSLEGDAGPLGTAIFNPHTLIAARLLASDVDTPGVTDWLAGRIRKALAWRDHLFDAPYYRLVHAEGDGLPGLVIDRYGDVLVVQANTAGMDRLLPKLIPVLIEHLAPKAIIGRNDSPARELEGLERRVDMLHGDLEGPVPVIENGMTYLADLREGQKTGWFYDHRDNRARVAGLGERARVLDLYSHTGGFGLLCALRGAVEVTCVDRSGPALALAEKAARDRGLGEHFAVHKGDIFAALEHYARTEENFDLVVADPPAFVKTRKDIKSGIKGYRKLARLCAPVIAPGGLFLAASCSHLVDMDAFRTQIARGLTEGGRSGRIVYAGGAGGDHPVHLHLPETAYLKALLISVD